MQETEHDNDTGRWPGHPVRERRTSYADLLPMPAERSDERSWLKVAVLIAIVLTAGLALLRLLGGFT